jgi:3-oxoacyl-[acyl-carrier protein] reductase
MTRKLEGKVAVVTGASKGIGAAIARALADEGAAVVVNYSSSKSGADHVVADIAARGGSAIAVQGDVSKRAHVERLFAEATKAFGRLDILVNNAGVYEFGPLGDVTEELFHKHFDLNVLGLLLTTKEAVRHMGPEGGSIINIGSGASSMRPPNSAVYTGSKAAVDAITGVLAKELGPRKIRVNSINPGMIETEGVHTAGFVGSDFQKMVETQSPLGRMGQPDDIAPTAVYLASADSKYMTGETLLVSGGVR